MMIWAIPKQVNKKWHKTSQSIYICTFEKSLFQRYSPFLDDFDTWVAENSELQIISEISTFENFQKSYLFFLGNWYFWLRHDQNQWAVQCHTKRLRQTSVISFWYVVARRDFFHRIVSLNLILLSRPDFVHARMRTHSTGMHCIAEESGQNLWRGGCMLF